MDQQTRLHVLRIDASVQPGDASATRRLGDRLVAALEHRHGPVAIRHRDLGAEPVPLIDADWVAANSTPPEDRTAAQRAVLAISDALVRELQHADILVVAVPVYNFGVPAALKAWVDLVARARLTFRYTDAGPEGLLRGKRAYLVVASGGVEVGGAADFASTYMRHVLGFLGIGDVTVVAAEHLAVDGERALERAERRIAGLIGATAAA